MWPFKCKREETTVNFRDILTGLQNAISHVQDMLQNRQLENLSNFWEYNGAPITRTVKLKDRSIDVPLVTLVPHSQLSMETVEIKFSTRIGSIAPVKPGDCSKPNGLMDMAGISNNLSHADFQMAMDGVKVDGEDSMQVSITFKVKDSPEAVSRLLDEYNKLI